MKMPFVDAKKEKTLFTGKIHLGPENQIMAENWQRTCKWVQDY